MQQLTSRVELSVSCRGLRDKDVFSKSDPMAVLYTKLASQADYREIARSEIIKNNLNPTFLRKFELDYFFEIQQKVKIEIYDVDSPRSVLSDHDFLGRFESSLGELVSRKQTEAKLTGPQVSGTISIYCEEMPVCKEAVIIEMKGINLDKKDFFGKSDPFIEIYRSQQSGVTINDNGTPTAPNCPFTLVHRTEFIKNTLNPNWRQFRLLLTKLCAGDADRLLRFDCHDWNASGINDFIGAFYTTFNQLKQKTANGSQNNFPLIHPEKKRKKKNYNNSGVITFQIFSVEIENTFLDYISGGTQLNFAVAIDFTASNGAVTNPSSLHHIDPYHRRPNQYESAIQAVGTIIQDYDFDKQFPGLGFGAKIPPRREKSDCFPLSFHPDHTHCLGVIGLLQAYQQAIRQVELYGPTNFAPVIRHVANMARQNSNGSQYFILLIITDGIISDMEQTISAIVDASFLPMSLIIVGVGNEDFSAMNMLDCDNGRLRSGQRVAERDIVQFVAMKEFVSRGDVAFCQAALAQEVLAELPDQLVQWMRRRGIGPLPRTQEPPAFDMSATVPPPLSPPPSYAAESGGYAPQTQAPYPSGGGGYASAPQPPPYSDRGSIPTAPSNSFYPSYPGMSGGGYPPGPPPMATAAYQNQQASAAPYPSSPPLPHQQSGGYGGGYSTYPTGPYAGSSAPGYPPPGSPYAPSYGGGGGGGYAPPPPSSGPKGPGGYPNNYPYPR